MSSRSCDDRERPCEFWSTSTPRQCNCSANKCAFKVQTKQTKYNSARHERKRSETTISQVTTDNNAMQTNGLCGSNETNNAYCNKARAKVKVKAEAKVKENNSKSRCSITYLRSKGDRSRKHRAEGDD